VGVEDARSGFGQVDAGVEEDPPRTGDHCCARQLTNDDAQAIAQCSNLKEIQKMKK
jgi:hypothetical protein